MRLGRLSTGWCSCVVGRAVRDSGEAWRGHGGACDLGTRYSGLPSHPLGVLERPTSRRVRPFEDCDMLPGVRGGCCGGCTNRARRRWGSAITGPVKVAGCIARGRIPRRLATAVGQAVIHLLGKHMVASRLDSVVRTPVAPYNVPDHYERTRWANNKSHRWSKRCANGTADRAARIRGET